jgi:acylphosphatase
LAGAGVATIVAAMPVMADVARAALRSNPLHRLGETAMPCIHCLVAGRVQGVWFRASTQREARRLGLTGWVRNLPDGRVELMASGPEAPLAELERWLHRGPPAAQVDEVITNSGEDAGWEDFVVQ